MAILVTGAAGFIASAVASALLARGEQVFGIDNMNDYYSVDLKRARLAAVWERFGSSFDFLEADFADEAALDTALRKWSFDRIVHLGAQAGVRYSIEHPRAYVRSNLAGHLNMLEVARQKRCSHFVYASSSSVYGGNDTLPFRVGQSVDHPVSLYAATKKADELMGESYAHLYRLPQTGLRFFTVYGPWGRPDMAVWRFTEAILNGRPIKVFGEGRMRRDFTYIDDVVAGVLSALDNPPADDGEIKEGGSRAPHAIYNLGNNKSEQLGTLIELIEEACSTRAVREMLPMQPGDVRDTYAEISGARRRLGFQPTTSLETGVPRFVDWYRSYMAQRSSDR
jgi:UDP-glucuronate 4-epimerase